METVSLISIDTFHNFGLLAWIRLALVANLIRQANRTHFTSRCTICTCVFAIDKNKWCQNLSKNLSISVSGPSTMGA